MLRVTAWILRWLNLHREKKQETLSVEEVRRAEHFCLQKLQKRHFSQELERLKANKPLLKDSAIIKLDPFYNATSGLIRVGGQLSTQICLKM